MTAIARFKIDITTGRFVLTDGMSVVEDGREVAAGSLPNLDLVNGNSYNQISAALATVGWRLADGPALRRGDGVLTFHVERQHAHNELLKEPRNLDVPS